MAKITPLYPQFVSVDNSCALRLIYDGRKYKYYRDGGKWDADCYTDSDGILRAACRHSKSLDGQQLVSISEKEWRKCNGEYVPRKFERYGWEHEITGQPTPKIETKNEYKYLLIRR
jgi:hypothetical protein